MGAQGVSTGSDDKDNSKDPAFLARRDAARQHLDALTGADGGDAEDRQAWFRTVYREAGGDPAAVPWADLAPKQALTGWLAEHPGDGRRALDVACGLGDNAEALADAGYAATAFDLAPEAIAWAKRRFPQTAVDYIAADLFTLPDDWAGAFDLVHECYTLQAMREPMRSAAMPVLAGLVAPGGRLLIISRSREEGAEAKGPPWPLMPSEWQRFGGFGLTLEEARFYDVERPDRVIPHVIAEFRRR
jgi:SAM-dependent methyltransferase